MNTGPSQPWGSAESGNVDINKQGMTLLEALGAVGGLSMTGQ